MAILEKNRTYELIELAQTGNKDALDILVKENKNLVYSVAQRFNKRVTPFEQDDLSQLGFIGLIKCIKKFDTSYNVEFSTYAVPMIIGEIRRFLRDDNYIKISRSLKELNYKIMKENNKFLLVNEREMTNEELSNYFNVDITTIIKAKETLLKRKSIYEEAATRNDTSDPILILDQIADERQNINIEFMDFKQKMIMLPKRMQKLLQLRYFDCLTQSEVSKELNISQVQVSRLEKKAIQMLSDLTNIPIIEYKHERDRGEKHMKKKQQIFEALDNKWSKSKIMSSFNLSEYSYRNYKYLHKKSKDKEKATEIAQNVINEIISDSPIQGLKEAVEQNSIVIVSVDFELTTGEVFKNASIFRPNPKDGDESIQSIVEIKSMFEGHGTYWKKDLISFQTETLNGHFSYHNVKEYKINIEQF